MSCDELELYHSRLGHVEDYAVPKRRIHLRCLLGHSWKLIVNALANICICGQYCTRCGKIVLQEPFSGKIKSWRDV